MGYQTRELYNPAKFKQLVIENYRFLETDFGFRRRKGCTITLLQTVPYTNTTTIVWIAFEKRENTVDVYMARIVRGRKPIDYALDPDVIRLGNLLALRAPSAVHYPVEPGIEGRYYYDSEIEYLIASQAAALKAYAADILTGDFHVLPEVKANNSSDWLPP